VFGHSDPKLTYSNKFLAHDNKPRGRHSGQPDITCTGNTTTIIQSFPPNSHPTMTDTELDADDARRLHLMEEMLLGRGYSRNQHGFWVAPGSRMTAAKVETVDCHQ